ncbi:unnamed protein product [Notodromas monacha]|uniref:Alpha-1,4-N-acetylglucosaminyltransferase n=1 Tax=Notodromas monacha TaxID=399045 RepID=A0A7R9GAV2_9CRUS|nr:unnamed protein product [Notodromas monacha]CAG0915855.1 unnamed protein product [Notodromas monacha]
MPSEETRLATILGSTVPTTPIPRQKIPENGIYFLETTGLPMLSPKQLCAIESAALHHPKRPVIVAVRYHHLQLPCSAETWTKTYPNVQFIPLDIFEWMEGTVVKLWLSKGMLQKSRFKTAHTSDILRYVTLFKYGGLYLDTDVIVMRPMDDLLNAVGLEGYTPSGAANGVMAFTKQHPVMSGCLDEVVQRVIKKFCGMNNTQPLRPGNCKNLQLLPTRMPMLSPKQLCAVESAALHHPKRSVVVAVTNKFLQLPIILKSWSEMYPNVMFIKLDIVQWLSGTILQSWLSKNLLDKSPFKTAHSSDVLRYATLFKYGGFYLDTDVIVMRSMDDLVNAVGLFETKLINGAAMAFKKHHPYMEACMNELSAKKGGHCMKKQRALCLECKKFSIEDNTNKTHI